jgi:uncharacterized protein (DUF305 family)
MRRLSIFLSVALLFGSTSSVPAQATGPYDASAVMFAQMMIPHHEQAVLISKLALKQGNNSAVKKLAARIIAEQGPEIAQMQKWITADEMMGMEMHSHMQGIVTPSDLAKLKAARGKKFDGLYLVDMTMHHQGAIAMATPLMKSMNPEVAALAKSIVSGQTAEIKEMRRIVMTGK